MTGQNGNGEHSENGNGKDPHAGEANGNGNGKPSRPRPKELHFINFDYTNSNGAKYLACGARRKNCPVCGYKYSKDERPIRVCPECGFDRRCMRAVPKGEKRCKRHSATVPNGVLHPSYRHGKTAMPISFPADVQKAYENQLKAMDARNVFSEMAVFATRIQTVSGRIANTSESDKWWQKLGALVEKVRAASAEGDDAEMSKQVNLMIRLAERGASEVSQWKELLTLCNGLAKLKQVQAGIERDHKAFLPADKAHEVIRVMAMAVREAMLTVRDSWREVAPLLDDREWDEMVERCRATGNWEMELNAWRGRIPRQAMAGSFLRADRVIQRQVRDLIPS